MHFDSKEFKEFLGQLTATREQVDEIMKSSPGADVISEVSMILVFQSLFDVLMETKIPAERLKLADMLKDIFSALNTRRDIERKSANASSEKTPLDVQSMSDLSQKLKLL